MKIITLLFIINLIFSLPGLGQEKKNNDVFFRVGIDPARLLSPLTYGTEPTNDSADISHTARFEVYSAIIYKKYVSFAFDGGYSQVNQILHIHTFDYRAGGFYFKPGFDANICYSDKIQNFAGMRLGFTNFKETGIIHVDGTYWNNSYDSRWDRNVFAEWIEVVTGLRLTIHRIGFAVSGRLRLLASYTKSPVELEERFIPGYGKNNSMSGGVNFEISYRLYAKQ
jgi:hypothetical protein